MGNVNTFLTEDDYQQIHDETGFSESQIRRLYSRFAHLDKRSKGYLMEDMMLIPELAVNPLGTRIIEAFFTDERNGKSSIETINFRQFVRTLARFKKSPRAQEGGLNTRDMKLDFVFKVYDTDRDGKISKEDLQHVLSAMVGLHIPKDQLNSIVRRTMKEADENEDNLIDMGEFTRCLEQLDLDDKMSIRFSQT
ncbi:calcineurin B homologous protein 1-like isoform X2 [Halichondria panicea]|uniref:calcineurin B homologous protein 1-like isoform X2 n=1 Tax=Halichondria panicea TaxID=6063 RepID=UPI00312BA1C8